MGVFYLCLHTVGLVRMEVVWVCFICVLHIVGLVRMDVVWGCFICVCIPWVWLGWRWCGFVLFSFI